MSFYRTLTGAFAALTLFAAAPSRTQQPTPPSAPTLRIPGFTAYSEPEMESLEFSEQNVIRGWTSTKQQIVWYGKFANTGMLNVALSLSIPKGIADKLSITIAKQTLTASVASNPDGTPVTVSFGQVNIPTTGYQRIVLEGVTTTGKTFGSPDFLLLSGPASTDAHFNLLERQRGAPSVHLTYPVPKETKVAWFYNEVTAKTDPLWSYYEACGWHRGYFGMQVNGPKERRIIFSVWDAGKEANDRSKVAEDNKVKLLAKGKDVFADSFGGEGTGGHSHLVYPWNTGQTYRFLVSAEPDGETTIYTGYFYFPERNKWGLIARFRAPHDGSYMHGLYSFDEDWNSPNGQQKRLAEFGNQWIKTPEGTWTELTSAVFTHTGKESRTDYDAGNIGNRFYLTGGGFVDGKVKYKDTVSRPATGKKPTDIVLPDLTKETK